MISFILQHAPALCLATPLLFAFLTPLAEKLGSKARNAFVLLGVLLTALFVFTLASSVIFGSARAYTMGAGSPGLTLPSGMVLPVRIILEVDAFSALMASLASLVAFFAAIYSFSFMKDNSLGKFYSLFFVMLTGLMGLLFTGDLFTLFVFFEVLSISSVALVAYWYNRKKSVEAAFKYLLISSVASLCLLFSIGLLYGEYGLLNIAALAASMKLSFVTMVALGLLIVAFSMKAGSAPMHYWLPDAYGEAPMPITVMLGIATLSSLYALLRVLFTLFGSFALLPIAGWVLICLGVVSMFIGVTMALKQDDLKRLIAYTAVSQAGFIFVAVGVGLSTIGSPALFSAFGENALKGGLFHLLNHGIYEALLFFSAGAVIYATGERRLSSLSGLARKMPFTTVFFLLGAMAIAGIPPLNGFASKILIYESVYRFNPLLTAIALVVSVLTAVPFVKAFSSAFLGPELREFKRVREAPKAMLLGMTVLAVIAVFIGLFPGFVVETIIAPAASALASQGAYLGAVL